MQQRGFTLVELSIVLVILGLLIGGVLTGQTLIRAAELRSVSTQHARFVTATHTFRDKYFALPGDMTNATAYWGIAGGTGSDSTCRDTASSDAKTCNGNADGRIEGLSRSNEKFRYWQQLANAGLIEGAYDGITHGSNDYSATIANSPAGRISSSLWHVFYWDVNGGSYTFDGFYGNSYMFGGSGANDAPDDATLKPEEAYNLDTKLDDSKPATGKVVMIGGLSACTTTSSAATLTADYKLSNSAIACSLIFRQLF